MESITFAQEYDFNETSFKNLMQKRIYKVLIICSNYDYYTLEEDDRIDEQVFDEYVSLNLRNPPIFIHANSINKAFQILQEEEIDLIITMLSVGTSIFDVSKHIKSKYPKIPIVVLTTFSREVSIRLQKEDLSEIDYVFSWLGSADILLAIIKLIEDKMNVEDDVKQVGVQVILLVEDSIRFYSSYLPNAYKIILKQTRNLMTEGLNSYKEMLRMRGRPKVLLATNYNQAIELYEKYKDSMLGIISDIRYRRNGEMDPHAGFRLANRVKKDDINMPFLLQSSEIENEIKAKELGIDFLHKYSKSLLVELRNYLFKNLAFGDFVFKDPDTFEEIGRAANLRELQHQILVIPENSLRYHFNRNNISRWLNARAIFPLAQLFKYLAVEDFNSVEDVRNYIHNTIASYRLNKGRGIIARFERKEYDGYLTFARIGEGSMGGKARGLAFIDSFLKRNQLSHKYKDILISIPRTIVITTDIFAKFMEDNHLYPIVLSEPLNDKQILDKFLEAALPLKVLRQLKTFCRVANAPLAIRSSSLLEDSQYQPFAGIYSTYMIPNTNNLIQMVEMLEIAIKSVYASVYFKASKAYMDATSNIIDEEQMGIIVQEVCGSQYDNLFYPTISGVARSINFYPIAPEKAEDGIANVAIGLGKITVEGGQTLRFSPKYPKKILQLSSPQITLRDTQKKLYALDLNPSSFKASTDDGVNIVSVGIKAAENHSSMRFVASTYDYQNNMIRHGGIYSGKKVITFANILYHNTFPLADIIADLLDVGQKEMGSAIEIEFAVNLDVPKGQPRIFNFLQIRPIVQSKEIVHLNLKDIKKEDCILVAEQALGNGEIKGVCDIVYVKPRSFNAAKTTEIADFVSTINDEFVARNKNYILVGPGRWGSSDKFLGIPVKWSQISAARLIVESGLENFRIDPSQGTHFFQNLTSFGVGYFTINPFINDGYYDIDYLRNMPAAFENEYIRHIHFEKELDIKIDGKNGVGIVLKQ